MQDSGAAKQSLPGKHFRLFGTPTAAGFSACPFSWVPSLVLDQNQTAGEPDPCGVEPSPQRSTHLAPVGSNLLYFSTGSIPPSSVSDDRRESPGAVVDGGLGVHVKRFAPSQGLCAAVHVFFL